LPNQLYEWFILSAQEAQNFYIKLFTVFIVMEE